MTNFETVMDLVKAVWKNDVIVPKDDPNLGKIKYDEEGIIVIDNGDGTVTLTRHNVQPKDVREDDFYEMPPFAAQVEALMQRAKKEHIGCNILLYGAMGTGKTEFVHRISDAMGFAKVYQVNGIEEMTEESFWGHLTCKVDAKTGQSYTPFEKGALYRAMIEGTEVDENGDQILYDKDGNICADGEPKVIGEPAVFFLDEFATVRPEVFLGVFNRVLEVPRNGGSRSVTVNCDGGKVVKSHPSFVMFFAGNTNGNGNGGKYQYGYTAQTNRMDASTLNRMSGTFRFGYNIEAERRIARTLNDDYAYDSLMMLATNVRSMYMNEKTETLFSTRTLVNIVSTAKAYRESGDARWLVNAVRDTVFTTVSEDERAAWNETIRSIWGVDLTQEENASKSQYIYL